VRHGGGARAQGAAFLAGVVITFLGLAVALIAARAAGQAAGWGFQLQAPVIVAALALIMLAAALNLSGLYEVGTSAQGLGAGLAPRGEIAGAFLTGVLAVVVAAPCTAPFMGPALGFALTQPAGSALAVFAALAVGFAAPFTALAFVPALTRALPKPGPWMEGLRHLLAFPMYGAAAWLAWVLALQAGASGLARILAAGVALAFAAWLFGIAQRRRAQSRGAVVSGVGACLSAICAAALVAAAPFAAAPGAASWAPEASAGTMPAQPWSSQKLAILRAAKTPVLVNFTAAWCVTCQVNERVAFSAPEVGAAFKRVGAVYLVADWTNRDPAIAKALADAGRIGVPLYLYYAPGAEAPTVLPQILTPALLVDALKA
jgi:thiol:disulfide interchange protein DsbD